MNLKWYNPLKPHVYRDYSGMYIIRRLHWWHGMQYFNHLHQEWCDREASTKLATLEEVDKYLGRIRRAGVVIR